MPLFLTFLMIALGAATARGEPSPLPALEKGTSTEVILDASGSMKAKLAGRTKLLQAKRVLDAFMRQALRENVQLAFRVYGLEEGNCKDTKLVLKFGKTSLEDVGRGIDRVNPKGYGKTPLALSLKKAAEDLATQPPPRRIVLLTDGMDTCGGDPCKTVEELRKDLDVKVYVVGYALDPEEQRQLRCIAEKSGGASFNATDTASLLDSIRKIDPGAGNNLFVRSPDPLASVTAYRKLPDGTKVPVKTFTAALGTSVPPGVYEVEVQFRKIYAFHSVEIAKGEKRTLVVKGSGVLRVNFLNKLMRVQVQNELGAEVLESSTDTDISVPAGFYKLKLFALPFAGTDVDDVKIYPDDTTVETVTDFGALTVNVPASVSPVPVGYYLIEEKRNTDFGSYLSGIPVVLPPGPYTVKSLNGLERKEVEIISRKLTKITLKP